VKALVVDASVAVKWVVDEVGSEEARTLQSYRLTAPDLLPVECSNVLWAKARRGELTPEEARERIDLLAAAPVELISQVALLPSAVTLAFELDHPIYDCLYLALAVERGLTLITADLRFHAAARRHPALGPRIVSLAELAADQADDG